MKKIALINQKGGVAKTTSTKNIAEGLAKKGKKVLVVDLDPQGNLTSSYDINKRKLNNTIYKLFKLQAQRKDYDILEYIFNKGSVDLIPNNIKMSKFDLEFGGAMSREHLLRKIFKNFIGDEYDYVLLDCPPSLGLVTYNALTLVDKVYIPLAAESFSIDGIADMIDTVEEVTEDLNRDLEIGGVFITRYKKITKLHKTLKDNLNKYFSEKMMNTKIRENIKVGEAIAMKESVINYAPSSNGAKDYMKLTDEIIFREEKGE
ncbi:MAG: ParA family protein [Fusobacteriota bacterium]